MYDTGPGGYGMDGGFVFGLLGMVFWLVVLVFLLWVYGRIIGRAGYSPWWALIVLVPVVDVVMLWVFAFNHWPALDDMTAAHGSAPSGPPSGAEGGAGGA